MQKEDESEPPPFQINVCQSNYFKKKRAKIRKEETRFYKLEHNGIELQKHQRLSFIHK